MNTEAIGGQMSLIDLYSDARTQPSRAMRSFMAEAEVGDEQEGEDPTVNTLIEQTCSLLGTEAAVYLPSGTMCNEIAIRVHCSPGDEIICHDSAHIIHFESGAPAALSGAMIRPISGPHGQFSAEAVEAAVRSDVRHDRYAPRSRLVVIEQTANLAGGTVWSPGNIERIVAVGKKHDLRMHMDGARLFNACAASGLPATAYARHFDSVWVDFSKGLGAPVGAVLAGSAQFIREAWRFKQQWGGSMRQAGIIAAGCLYALRNNLSRLELDHELAVQLARGLSAIPGLRVDPERVETNIVLFDVADFDDSAETFVRRMRARGIGFGAFGLNVVRAVTHMDISAKDIQRVVETVASAAHSRSASAAASS